MSREIEDLHPTVRAKCRRFLRACQAAGLKVMVTHTYRSSEEQAAIYAQGRTAPGEIVTNAPPGYSWHEFGRAFDVAEADRTPYDIGAPGLSVEDEWWWSRIGEIGEACGLEWGGRWKHPDRQHLEDRGGMTLKRARARGYRP